MSLSVSIAFIFNIYKYLFLKDFNKDIIIIIIYREVAPSTVKSRYPVVTLDLFFALGAFRSCVALHLRSISSNNFYSIALKS